MAPDASRSFFGHPRALSSLFFTEMWERFSYYGMRALLVLFLVDAVKHGGFGLDDRTATAIYGLYTACVYLSGLPGGWIADRLIGAQAAVLWGAVLIGCGHLLLALPGGPALFYVGLAFIVLGTGLLKPNISALVAGLYPEGGSRRDAGFTVFYMAINLGAFLGPLATAWLAQRYGWHAGFLTAAVCMGLGIVYFLRTRSRLGTASAAAPPPRNNPGLRRDWQLFLAGTALTVALIAAVAFGLVRVSAIALQAAGIYVILAMALAYFVYLLFFAGLDRTERQRAALLALLFCASAVFWSGFEQGGSSMSLFAQRYTDRMLGSFEIPAGWFQSINSAFIIVFAPLMSGLWLWLERRGRDLGTVPKFILGLLGMALGFGVMALGARVAAGGGLASPSWLVFVNLLHTWGELCLSPVGMSATTQLVPRRFVGQSMGIWFVSMALGNLLASVIAGGFEADNIVAMPGQYLSIFWYGTGAALLLFIVQPLFRRATPTAR